MSLTSGRRCSSQFGSDASSQPSFEFFCTIEQRLEFHGDDETVEAKRRRKDKPGKADGVSGRARKTELPAGAQKPIKWKPLIAKELATCGGRMHIDELRKAAVAEARAHPSHSGRQTKELKEEFDRVLPTFKRFVVEGNQVRVAS